MFRLTTFAQEQRAALESGDVDKALQLLNELEQRARGVEAWRWLRTHPIESYDQLIAALERGQAGRTRATRSTLRQLIRVFRACQDHGIALEHLDIPRQLPKYYEAAAKMNAIVSGGVDLGARLESAIHTIRSHSSRDDTRAWARTPRKPRGH